MGWFSIGKNGARAHNHEKRDNKIVSGVYNSVFFAAAQFRDSTVVEAPTLMQRVVRSNLGHGKGFFLRFFLHQVRE